MGYEGIAADILDFYALLPMAVSHRKGSPTNWGAFEG